ncbi:MAG TPA: zf-HC2 domain-containing protein, partial [Gemmataceae bacterium]|nr:zf-HC2 domain-containing protein [Gemmataceae bacterium]
MDCRTARLLLDFARPCPAELPADEAAALEGHLTGCPDCDSLSRAERQLDDHLGRAVRAVPEPQGLRGRLLERLAGERRAWNHRWLVPSGGIAAAAAVLALALFTWWQWPRPPQQVNVQAIVDDLRMMQNASPEQVEDGFKEKYGMTATVPREFDGLPLNYALLTYYGPGFCQGRIVPMLFFQRGNDRAYIYIVSGKQFDLKDAANLQPENSG